MLPYGPLHLEVGNASYREANILKNLYLGVAGAAFGVDAAALANSFHCGPDCVQSRRSDLESNLSRIEPLVTSFEGLAGVRVVAQWGMGDDVRINELFRIMGQLGLARLSPVMGFIPSGEWQAVSDAEEYIMSLGTSSSAVYQVVQEMRELSLAALVREPEGLVRVIRVGIGDNESGLLFSTSDVAPHRRGDQLTDGREIILIESVKPRVYFYETS